MLYYFACIRRHTGGNPIPRAVAGHVLEDIVKEKIHPAWHGEARVHCACGNTFTAGSTRGDISVEICSSCHPFYTGTQKFVDTAGRVDKFNQKVAKAQAKQAEAKARKEKKAEAASANV